MFSKILVLTLCISLAIAETAVQAGLKTSLDIAVLNQAKVVYFEEILKLINNLQLPDLEDDDGNYIRENTFEIMESSENVEFTTDVDNNAVILANKKVSAQFRSGKFRYKVAPLIVAKGHATVDMHTVDIEVGMSFSTKTLRSGQIVPKVDTVDIVCDIDRFDINIHLFGNLVTDIGSLFEVFFVGTVANVIEDTVKLTLNRGIPLITNNIIESTNGFFPVPFIEHWVVDWQTPEAAVVTSSNVGVGIKGLFFDNLIGEEEPTDKIPEMPLHSSSHVEKFQTYLSSYVINGFCNSMLEVIDVKGWIRSSMLHDLLTTTTLDALLPGMIKYYGAGQPVDVYFQMHQLGQFQSFAGNQEMKGVATLDIQFWIPKPEGYPEYAAGLTITDATFGFIAPIDDMTLTLQITKLHIDQIEVTHCAWGELHPRLIKLEVNVGERIFEPIMNKWLRTKPIQFPTEIFGMFKLEELTLSYYDDYVYAGITPVFIGPTSAAKPEPTFDTNSYQVEYVRQERLSVDSDTGEETLTISYVEVLDEMVQF